MSASEVTLSLQGKTILVTGASSGIGREIAIACAGNGAYVILTARREEALRQTLQAMDGTGYRYICADLTKAEDRDRLVEEVPVLDGVVHCAGISVRTPCKMISEEHIRQVMDINFSAQVLLQTALLQEKRIKSQASIVFMASRAASFPSPGNAIYSASKGALISYAKCLGLELAGRKIRVNCISPGMVWTDLVKGQGIEEADLRAAEGMYPLKRFGTPADVAHLTLYLLSDLSSWMTGSCLDISGGGEGLLA